MDIRRILREKLPTLSTIYWDELAPRLIPIFPNNATSRTFNDPVWRSITLSKAAAHLLSLPLLQRLRYTRQLGAAHLIYPGAHHSRLEHSLGCAHAAGLMFESLHSTAKTKLKNPQCMRDIIVCSALMHDCGHTVFSHSGEKILENRFHNEWQEARSILGEWLPPTFSTPGSTHQDRILSSGAAELATLMFLLSPNFEEHVKNLGWQYPPYEAVQMMASFVVGRPLKKNLLDENNAAHTYLSRIVSGDMDADKLDYVARDAFYAGLPITVDTSRLLDQLKAVSADQHTLGAIEKGLHFGAHDPSSYYLFGMSPAGIAALELFVFTRSHLFDRIYSHHKVSAAEMYLEETMGLWINAWQYADESNFIFMNHLYAGEGDDGYLALLRLSPFNGLNDITKTERLSEDISKELERRATALIERRLPYRALAIFSRSLPEEQPAKILFQNHLANIFENTGACEKFKTEIDAKLKEEGEEDAHILICPAKRNPVKENPDIWVATNSLQTLQMVNSRFNVEQLANAYRDIKQIHWIFCESEKRETVAAAVAWILKEKYDVKLGHQSFEKAKLSIAQVVEKLRNFNNKDVAYVISSYESDLQNAVMHLTQDLFSELFPKLKNHGPRFVSSLVGKLNNLSLPYIYYEYLFPAFNVLNFLMDHATSQWCKADYEDEKAFQADLNAYLLGRLPPAFKLHSHEEKVNGETDLVIDCDINTSFVIELKNTSLDLSEAFDKNAGQAAAYACDSSVLPVSFLYTVFNDSTGQTRLEDAIDIRTGLSDNTKHVVICIGLQRKTETPSKKGRYNKK